MKILIKIIVFFVSVIFLQTVLFRLFPNLPPYPSDRIEDALKSNPDIILFGDSVMVSTNENDSDKRYVNAMLLDKVPNLKLKTIDYLAYTPDVYLEYVKYITKSEYRPRLVIVPINIRTFSPQWDQKPSFQFEMEKLNLRYKNTPLFPFLKFLINTNLFSLTPISQNQYNNTPVYSSGQLIGTIQDFENPEYETYTEEHQKNKILLYYTSLISKNHRKLKALEEISDLLSAKNIKTIFYITPIDHETCKKYTGQYANNMISTNISLIKKTLEKNPVIFLDLSFKLPSDHFNWKMSLYINEHLNEKGRQFLASELAASVIDALKNNK